MLAAAAAHHLLPRAVLEAWVEEVLVRLQLLELLGAQIRVAAGEQVIALMVALAVRVS
jgi:hypothetical protein